MPGDPQPVDRLRVFYAAGPGNAIAAHRHWAAGDRDPTEVSVTYSSQVEQYCRDVGAALYIVGHPDKPDFLEDGDVVIEHLPKAGSPGQGLRYHWREAAYGLKLLKRARRFRANVAILDSGCTQFFMQSLFAATGMRVVPVIHNALWLGDERPRGAMARLVQALDGLFWRLGPVATLCVSPVSAAQIRELGGARARPTRQFRAQFYQDFFARIPPPPPHSSRPFRIMFVGRITEAKGVFQLLEMAQSIERLRPGVVRWTVCGTGPDLEELRRRVTDAGLGSVVDLRGWTSPEDQIAVYAASHASIVPSIATEGLPMAGVESLLAGRPLIASPAALTLDALKPAAIICRRGDVGSYVEGILRLVDNPDLYAELASNGASAAGPFLDRRHGLTQALKDVLGE